MDIELAFADEFKVMQLLHDVVKFMVGQVNKKNKKELDYLSIKLKEPKAEYFTYRQIIDLLKKKEPL